MSSAANAFLDSRDFARIARAIRYIDTRFHEQPQLAAVAAHVGLSEFHFNRLFRRWAGLTPKQYLTQVTGTAARRALGSEGSVLEAAHAVGLSGPSRLHDLVITLEAMTPGELKAGGAGVRIRLGRARTPFGSALLALTDRGLASLQFLESHGERGAEAALRARWPRARFEADDAGAQRLVDQLWPTRTKTKPSPLRLAVTGTNFQLKVWQALLALDAEEHTSYGELAAAIGAPTSVRAVANAVGANPIAWLIPCHRVLRKSGALGGYRWGEDRKRAILRWEQIRFGSVAPQHQSPDSRRVSISGRDGKSLISL